MDRKSASERAAAAIASRLDDVTMSPTERQEALHALRMGALLAELLLGLGDRVRGLRRAVQARQLRRARRNRRTGAGAALTRGANALR